MKRWKMWKLSTSKHCKWKTSTDLMASHCHGTLRIPLFPNEKKMQPCSSRQHIDASYPVEKGSLYQAQLRSERLSTMPVSRRLAKWTGQTDTTDCFFSARSF